MKLASFETAGRSTVGVVVGDRVVDIAALDPAAPSTMRELLAQPPGRLAAWAELAHAASDRAGKPVDDVRWLPVVPDPRAIWCAALTYLSHVREGGDRPIPEYPLFFLRVADSQVGHLEDLVVPAVSDQLDFEGELAVVIGAGGRHIPQERALEHVAGFSCYNEGSVRDWQRHTSQITPGKNFAASGGFGPWLVTPDEFGNPYSHTMTTRVNGEVMQSASISELLFGIEYMISYLSTIHPLRPGDVIVTGTSGGVGIRRDPPVFLRPGDIVEVEIDGIGTLRNSVGAEQATEANPPAPRTSM